MIATVQDIEWHTLGLPEWAARARRKSAPVLRPANTAELTANNKTILQRVAAGEQAAVAEFINQYGDLVWSLARRYLGNEADAEDAVQDVFIEIWSSAGRYDPNVAGEVAFVSTITRRRMIDRLRKSSRRPGMESIDDQVESRQPSIPTPLDDDAELAQVERVLEDMEPEHRKILSMSLYEGYSHSEIAARLDMPLGTVKTRVRRGLMHVRETLRIAEESQDDSAGTVSG